MKRALIIGALMVACPALAFAQSAADLKNAANTPDRVLTYGMSYSQQRFSHAHPDQPADRQPPRARMVLQPRQQQRRGVAGARARWRDVHHQPRQDRRASTPSPARRSGRRWRSYPPETTTRGVLRHRQSRRRALQRQVLPHHPRWPRSGARPEDRQGNLEHAVERNVGGPRDDRRAADRERRRHRRRRGRGVHARAAISMATTPKRASDCGGATSCRGRARRARRPGPTTRRTRAAAAPGRPAPTIPTSISCIWGTGNPSPWNALDRPGDNLFTNTIMALRPKTGEMVWHYQASPNDPFDYDNVQALVLADMHYRRPAAQSGDAGLAQRLLLCARPHQRKAPGREQIRQGDMGRPHRHGDRTSGVVGGYEEDSRTASPRSRTGRISAAARTGSRCRTARSPGSPMSTR